jgi:hypothetical protein
MHTALNIARLSDRVGAHPGATLVEAALLALMESPEVISDVTVRTLKLVQFRIGNLNPVNPHTEISLQRTEG